MFKLFNSPPMCSHQLWGGVGGEEREQRERKAETSKERAIILLWETKLKNIFFKKTLGIRMQSVI